MGIREIIEKFRGVEEDQEDELPDDVTRDKYLRSLRRQRRVQLEEIEKEQLKKQIKEHNMRRLKRFGVGSSYPEEKKVLIKALKNKKHKVNILAEQRRLLGETSLLNNKVNEFKKKKQKKQSFYDGSIL